MGTCYIHTCNKCGYEVSVSGGDDVGMHVRTRTMTCQQCKEVVDVAIGPSHGTKVIEGCGECSQCGSKAVVRWEQSKPCPKCDGQMVKGEPSALWD